MRKLVLVLLSAFSIDALAAASTDTSRSNLQQHYGQLPLSFEVNRGQIDTSVKFLSRGQGYSLFLTKSGAVLSLSRSSKALKDHKVIPQGITREDNGTAVLETTEADIVRMSLLGGNPNAPVSGESELPGKVNYFLGSDPAKWHSDLPTYSKVRYSSVYPGIDLIYYGNQHQLEYDFAVAPGANPASIRLSFTGQRRLTIATNGDLVLQGADGRATLHKPVVYQRQNGHRQPIPGSFRLFADNTVAFRLGNYDHTRTLIIDPVLVYSTYLGGSVSDQGNGIAVDTTAHAYVVGTTSSANFPITSPVFQTQNFSAPGSAVFVTKLNAAGNALQYSTYLGGSGGDFGYGIAIDSLGNAYVTGATYSHDFPVTCGSLQTTNPSTTAGALTAFVAKLDVHGSTLLYSTYLGGSGNHAASARGDVSQAIAVDAHNNAYVTGYTFSSDFLTTDTAFQLQNTGGTSTSNAFVTKLNAAGTALVYSTYLGGSGSNGAGDYGNAIAIDSSGDAFITGSTASDNFPVIPMEIRCCSEQTTAFVTKLNPTGTDEIYSIYLGGTGTDSGQAIAVDNTGTAYVSGNTTSNDFPLTVGVVEGTDNGPGALYGQNGGAFVTKLSTDGNTLVYSTNLEGRLTSVTGLAVDGSGNTYITGSAQTAGAGSPGEFISTPHALATPLGGTSGFLVKLDPTASAFQYATLLGGNSIDKGTALAVDTAGNVYLTGSTSSTNFPTTNGVFQKINHGAPSPAANAFVTKFAIGSEVNETTYPGLPSRIGTSLNFTGGIQEICNPEGDGQISFSISASLNTDSPGPSPTGYVTLWGDLFDEEESFAVPGEYGPIGEAWVCANDCSLEIEDWSVSYSGDDVYAPSFISGEMDGYLCPGQPRYSVLPPRSLRKLGKPGSTLDIHPTRIGATSVRHDIASPRYSPPPASRSGNAQGFAITSNPDLQQSPTCIAPSKPTLTVSVSSASRQYGSTNPTFAYTTVGLLRGDVVTVNFHTTAVAASPVGQYPITATVSGGSADKYNAFVVDGTLTVTPAPLSITVLPAIASRHYGAANPIFNFTTTGLLNGDTVTLAPFTIATTNSPVGAYAVTATIIGSAGANYTPVSHAATLNILPVRLSLQATGYVTTYGQTPPPPTAYTFKGFINGDTANVVSGTPALSTTVTATTPVGYYPIQTGVGTLTATNYTIVPFAQKGAVHVTKALLTLHANNLTIHREDPIPPFTYTLSGFVNGDTPASSVTGAPIMRTDARSQTRPGTYPIYIAKWTLASSNYDFTAIDGTLTILP